MEHTAIETPLKRERLKRGLTTVAVARAVGVAQPQISRVENGTGRPSLDLANRLAKYFDDAVTRDQILYPRDYPEMPKQPAKAQQLRKAS